MEVRLRAKERLSPPKLQYNDYREEYQYTKITNTDSGFEDPLIKTNFINVVHMFSLQHYMK